MKNKRILLFTRPIIPPWNEGSKNLAYEIACNCNDTNCQFCVLTTKEADFPIGKLTENSNAVLEKIYSSAHLGKKEKIQLFKRLFHFPLGADVIHFLFTPRNLTSWLIKFRLFFSRAKTIQTIATVDEKLYQNPNQLKKIFFANKIVAQSKYTRNRLQEKGLKNVTVIYPGIDLQRFQPTSKDLDILKKFGFQKDDFILIFAGEYTRLEAVDDVINAFLELVKNHSSFRLIMACRIMRPGDKTKKKEIVDKISKLGYAKNVVFIDTFPDMSKLFNLSDVSIFPPQKMNGKVDIPMVLIESMACKKPIIVTDLPVFKEFIQNGYNGLVVKKGQPKQLANAILKLKEDSNFRQKLGEQARKFALKNFDILKNVKDYEKIYIEL